MYVQIISALSQVFLMQLPVRILFQPSRMRHIQRHKVVHRTSSTPVIRHIRRRLLLNLLLTRHIQRPVLFPLRTRCSQTQV